MLDMKTMLGSSAPKEDEDVLVRNLLAMRDRRLPQPPVLNNGDALKTTLGEKPPGPAPAAIPPRIEIAAWLIYWGVVLSTFVGAREIRKGSLTESPLLPPEALWLMVLLNVILMAFLVKKILDGRKWAKWLYVITFILPLHNVYGVLREMDAGSIESYAYLVAWVFYILAAGFISVDLGWFRKKTKAWKTEPPKGPTL